LVKDKWSNERTSYMTTQWRISIFIRKAKINGRTCYDLFKRRFEKNLSKVASIHGYDKNDSKEGSSKSNPLVDLEDFYYKVKKII